MPDPTLHLRSTMTEEQVVNVHGEEISENGDDHRKIKANGVARKNGDVGGETAADSSASDLVADDGTASEEEHRRNGESHVTVSEAEPENNRKDAVSNGSADEVTEITTREGESGQNGSGSVAVSEVVADTVVQNGVVKNEIRDDDHDDDVNAVSEELVTDHDDFVVVGAADVQNGGAVEDDIGSNANSNGVKECKILAGDENGLGETVVADEQKSDREFAGVDVHNGVMVDRVEEEVTATATDENSVNDAQGRSESILDKSEESENVDSADASDEKDNVTNENDEVEDSVENNEVPVVVDSISAATNVKECASENAQNSLEKAQVEPVSDAGGGDQNGLAEPEPEPEPSECTEENEIPLEGECGCKLERSEEEPGSELVPEGENLSAVNSTDMIGVANVMSDIVVESKGEPSVGVCEMKNNAEDSEADSSINAVMSEDEPSVEVSEIKNNAVECEAEPSNTAVQCGSQPSIMSEMKDDAVGNEAEPSNTEVQSESEPSVVSKTKNDAVESEAEPLNTGVQSETEPSVVSGMKIDAVESEAESSKPGVQSENEPSVVSEMKNDAVESEAEPSSTAVHSETKPSVVSLMKNDTVESEVEPSYIALQSESEPSVVSEMKDGAAEFEAELSNGILQSEGEPSFDVSKMKTDIVEREAELSNGTVQSEEKPSADMSEMKTNTAESEAEPSNGMLQSEGEPTVDVSETTANAVECEAEPSNGTLQSEGEPSVDVSEMKTSAVESDAELSVEGGGSNHGDENSRHATNALDGQNMGAEVVKKPFYYLIKVPRYDDDENIKDQIKNALHLVDEKTKNRDALRAENHTIKASCKDCGQEVRAAIAAERAARDLLKSKRQEMDSVQSVMNRLNNAISVGDIDGKIRNMEHMIQHETLPLNEEKQLIRQIKQLKQNREELSSNMRKQDQSQQSLDHKDKDSIEEHFKHLQLLKKEMEALRNNVLKAEAATKIARNKYDDECKKLNELLARFKAADDIRQEAYAKLQALKKQLHEKSKYFWEYRNAANKGQELAAEGKKEELQRFCIDQVERIMELWNKNDEFRRDYVRCNTRSTLRRLQTLDGRSLGPDEEPPIIPNAITERAFKINSMVSQSTMEQEKKSISTESVITKEELVSQVAIQKTERSQTTKAKKPTKPVLLEKPVARWGDESDEDTNVVPLRTKEEEERILKAEQARKEEEAAKLKEKRRLEEIEKAKEALQRKKRNAEKAQQRAVLKAQKEAEMKEKEREKKARKKERRKAASADTAAENTEQEPATSSETLTRSVEECDQIEKPAEVTKKPQKLSQFTKQTKAKSLPPALRNRGKRRIQPWMWVLIAVLVAVALFYMGNSSSLKSSLESFGF